MRKPFNLKNPTERRVLEILANGEGIISREEFLAVSNNTMLSKYRAAGYLRQMPNAPKGVYQTTEAFKAQYHRQVDPAHEFSGGSSPVHASGVNRILSDLPDGVAVQTGQSIQNEFRHLSKDRYSTADLALTMSRGQLDDFLTAIHQHYLNYDFPHYQQYLYNVGVLRLQELAAAGEESTHFYVEIVTSNYGTEEIQAKEAFSYQTDTPIIYIPA